MAEAASQKSGKVMEVDTLNPKPTTTSVHIPDTKELRDGIGEGTKARELAQPRHFGRLGH